MVKFKVGDRVRVISQGPRLGNILYVVGCEIRGTYRVDETPNSDTGWVHYEYELEKVK